MDTGWTCEACNITYGANTYRRCPKCGRTGSESVGLIERIESLERWRRCKYGTYQATDEDYEEWSGRKPGEWVMD